MKFFSKKPENNPISSSSLIKKNLANETAQLSYNISSPFIEPGVTQEVEKLNSSEIDIDHSVWPHIDVETISQEIFKKSLGSRLDFNEDYLSSKFLNKEVLEHYLLKSSEITDLNIYKQSFKNYLKCNKKNLNKRKGRKIILIHDSFMTHRSKIF
jgi:hypothetical protein